MNRAPNYCHSVYSVGQMKPKLSGIKDLKSKDEEFAPNELTAGTPATLFFNTGKLSTNPDLKDIPSGALATDQKVNEFIAYDEA